MTWQDRYHAKELIEILEKSQQVLLTYYHNWHNYRTFPWSLVAWQKSMLILLLNMVNDQNARSETEKKTTSKHLIEIRMFTLNQLALSVFSINY